MTTDLNDTLNAPLCACGCGDPTARIAKTDTSRGYRAGAYRTYKRGHHARLKERRRMRGSRPLIYVPGHPRADAAGWVYEHIVVAERALGRFLPAQHPVHHVNGIKQDNRPDNLVLCEDAAYHALLHQRQRAVAAGRTPTARPCMHCLVIDELVNMKLSGRKAYHVICHQRWHSTRTHRRTV